MPYLRRLIDIKKRLENKSYFLLGPRQTGKSSLVQHELPEAKVYNLLDSKTFLALSSRPSLVQEELAEEDRLIVIDEIQKMPQLLDEVHLIIEQYGIRFLLTGSSARKLRRGGVNLLGGRARSLTLHPLIYKEIPDFDLLRALSYGLLPSIYLSDDPRSDLEAYAGLYLQQEVAAEGLARHIPAFSRFLEVAALCNGTPVNFTSIASDAQVARSTVQEYFKILQDTLMARLLPAFARTVRRKPISRAKFYFFDIGVVRYLRHEGKVRARSPGFGEAFESFIFHELSSYVDYTTGGKTLSYWRSTSNFEVDFILNDATAIEVKGAENISDRALKGLRALQEEQLMRQLLVVCQAERPRRVEGIQIVGWRDFIERLWQGEFD
jgi:predicted AAA+ superfamily ATPase